MGKAIQTAAKLGATALVAGAVAGGIASIKMAANFETAFAEVTTLFDAPKDQIEELRKGVLRLSATMGVDATEATNALYQAISAGVAPENALEFLNENVKLAVGGVTELSTAVDLTTTVMNAFGLAEKDLTRINDTLFTTVRLGKTTVDELGNALFNVAPIAAAAGASIEDVGSALAVLTASGVRTSEATTQLRAAIQALTAPTVRQKQRAEDMGIALDTQAIATKGLEGAFKDLFEQTGGNLEQLRLLLGSVEAVQAVLILGGEGAEAFAEANAAMAEKSGAANAAFETMNETAARQWQIVKTQLSVAMIDLGTRALPAVAEGAILAQGAISLLTGNIDGLSRSVLVARIQLLELSKSILDTAFKAVTFGASDIPFLEKAIRSFGGNLNVMDTALDAVESGLDDARQAVRDFDQEIANSVNLRMFMGIGVPLGAAPQIAPPPPSDGGFGADLGAVIADGFERALIAADLPAVAADELIKVLDFLQAVADNRMPTLLDQLNFVQAMADNAAKARAELAQNAERVMAELEAAADARAAMEKERIAAEFAALQELQNRVIDLTDSLGLFTDAFDLPLETVREIAREFGFIPPEVDLIGQALSELHIPVPEAFEFFNAMEKAADAAREQADALEESLRHMEEMAALAQSLFGVLRGRNISRETLQGALDVLNPNIPGPFTDVPPPPSGLSAIPRTQELPAGTPVTQTITVIVEDRSPAAIAHAVERAGLELGEQLIAEGV